MLLSKIVEACTPWHVDKTYHLYDLTIREGAQLIAPEGKRYIFRPWTTINGKVVYAWQYGIKAFPILVDDN